MGIGEMGDFLGSGFEESPTGREPSGTTMRRVPKDFPCEQRL